LALAPRRIEDALRLIASLGLDQRRVIGLIALALGVALVWLGSASDDKCLHIPLKRRDRVCIAMTFD
jgi:hypothetical protein